MLIFKGSQGIGKSTFFQAMCGNKDFYQENLKDIDNFFDYTNGKWIVEMGELSAFKKAADNEKLKDFVTKQVDTYRKPYDRLSEDYYRQFVLIGTTNETVFLNDDTGNRRFVVVECANDSNKDSIKKKTYLPENKLELQQILAEVYQEYKDGKAFTKIPDEFQQALLDVQSKHSIDETEKGLIETYLEQKEYTCLLQIWCEVFGHKKSDAFPMSMKNKITKIIMSFPNWQKYTGSKDGRKNFSSENAVIDGYSCKMNYGKQVCYEKFTPLAEIKELENKKQQELKQRSNDAINNIMGTANKDYYNWGE